VPLDKSCSLDAFQGNVSRSYKEGKRAKGTQHVAIALSTLKRACGVPDDDQKMTPKEIVAAGSKGEGVFIRLSALIEKESAPASSTTADPEVVWLRWIGRLQDVAGMAVKEAGRWKRGPATDKLIDLLQDFVQKRVAIPTFESADPVPGYTPWLGWVGRLEMAASNRAIPELAVLIREFKAGRVGVPPREMAERFGFDFAVRTSSPSGATLSPSSAPPEVKGGNDSGTFRAYADGGQIKSGDGRAPKLVTKKKTKV
jgi:hypothetical protein